MESDHERIARKSFLMEDLTTVAFKDTAFLQQVK
jgi:hypothetical protein